MLKDVEGGFIAYCAAVEAGEITANAGDWALFHQQELHALLPGMRMPKAFRRAEYLANLVREPVGLCFDFYSLQKLPLLRHPL